MPIPVAVTVDVHPCDEPSWVLRCNDFFLARNILVTFLVSTSFLEKPNSVSAINELASLGYHVDCSATPQRPGFLSSLPLENPWLFAPRTLHWLTQGLLEVPTTTLFLPLASPSFAMLREMGSRLFLQVLKWEVRRSVEKVLVISFDTPDFDRYHRQIEATFSWRQLIPSVWGGFQWRYWLRTYDQEQIFSTTVRMFESLTDGKFVTLAGVFNKNFPATLVLINRSFWRLGFTKDVKDENDTN